MRANRLLLVACAMAWSIAASGELLAADPAAPKPAAGAKDSAPADAPADTGTGQGKDAKARPAKPGSPDAGKSSSTPERFEPSEKVRPDFDVAFPVDI